MSIPMAQSIGMTGFQRCGIMGTWGDLEGDLGDKMAQSVGTTGVDGFSGLYRGPGRPWEAVRQGGGAPWGEGPGFKQAQSDSNNDFKTP